jgi:hypothetical protein
MVKVARYYGDDVSTGAVLTPDQGLALLIEKLQNGLNQRFQRSHLHQMQVQVSASKKQSVRWVGQVYGYVFLRDCFLTRRQRP